MEFILLTLFFYIYFESFLYQFVHGISGDEHGPVDETLLVLDATTGQNGLTQARVFTEVVDVTGIVLTKLDGTARGGIVLSVQRELGAVTAVVSRTVEMRDPYTAGHQRRVAALAIAIAHQLDMTDLDIAELERLLAVAS